MDDIVKKTLEKQLELLSKRSEDADLYLPQWTDAMVKVAELLCYKDNCSPIG